MDNTVITNEELETFLRSIKCNENDIALLYTNPTVKKYYTEQYLIYQRLINNFDGNVKTR